MGSEKRSTRATEANDSGGARARTWRWGVWHEDDRAWLASLQERNARLLPLLQSDRCTAPAATATPRVIHQIWLGPHPIPESCRAWMQTWTAHHPTWEYVRAYVRVREKSREQDCHTDDSSSERRVNGC